MLHFTFPFRCRLYSPKPYPRSRRRKKLSKTAFHDDIGKGGGSNNPLRDRRVHSKVDIWGRTGYRKSVANYPTVLKETPNTWTKWEYNYFLIPNTTRRFFKKRLAHRMSYCKQGYRTKRCPPNHLRPNGRKYARFRRCANSFPYCSHEIHRETAERNDCMIEGQWQFLMDDPLAQLSISSNIHAVLASGKIAWNRSRCGNFKNHLSRDRKEREH